MCTFSSEESSIDNINYLTKYCSLLPPTDLVLVMLSKLVGNGPNIDVLR